MIETPRPTQRDETPGLAPVSPVVSLIVGGESPQLRSVIAGPDGCPKCSRGVEAHRPCSAWHRQPPQRASWRVPAPDQAHRGTGAGDPAGVCPLRRRLPLAADQRPRPPTLRVGSRAPGGAPCAPTTPNTTATTAATTLIRTALSCHFAAAQPAPALRSNGSRPSP